MVLFFYNKGWCFYLDWKNQAETAHIDAAEDVQGSNLWPKMLKNMKHTNLEGLFQKFTSMMTWPNTPLMYCDCSSIQTWFCAAPCRPASACARRDSQRCCRQLDSWTSAPPSPSWRSPQQGTRKGMWRPVVPLTPPCLPPSCPDAPGGPGTCSPTDQVRPHETF